MRHLLAATFLFFTTHLRRSASSRRTLLSAALALVPGAVAWTLAKFALRISATDIAAHIGWLILLQVVLPILALVGGTAVVAEEVEDRTITYLFSRPIPRAAVLLGRWLATLVVLSVVLSIGSGFLLWAAQQPAVPRFAPSDGALDVSRTLEDGIALPLLQAVLLGALVYSALFSIAGTLFKHPMIIGLAYAFVIEGFLADLPGKNQALTIQYYLRSWIAAYGSEAWSRVEGFAGASFDTPRDAIATLLVIWAAALALGCWHVSRREFVLTS
jgi:ABC-type transport system involved in multi-copper enzyme maturation permease subunit